MNLKHILHEIEKVDPEVYDRLDTRRASLREFSGIGKKIALTALPLALGGLFKKTYAQTTTVSSVLDILNYALTLEYLESEFYTIATGTSGLIPAAELPSFNLIKTHEVEHVNFLTTVIKGMGTPATKPTFDFTVGGTYPAFTDYATFLTLSQAFEDTGVRAYKGQANNANLMASANTAVLNAALQIHSMEARHASHVRMVRRKAGVADAPKPWITGNIAPIPDVAATYAGEDNVAQGGTNNTTAGAVTITSLPNSATSANVTTSAATEAFDEPLTMTAVLAIAGLFIVK